MNRVLRHSIINQNSQDRQEDEANQPLTARTHHRMSMSGGSSESGGALMPDEELISAESVESFSSGHVHESHSNVHAVKSNYLNYL